MERKIRIGVIGSGDCSGKVASTAEEVGRQIALKGAILISGGLCGVMEAASKGAKSAGGQCIGILPGTSSGEANPHIDIPIVTGLGEVRNIIVVRSSDSLIAVGGGYGTLSEIAFALKLGVPVVGIDTWSPKRKGYPEPNIIVADSARDAVAKAIRLVQERVG